MTPIGLAIPARHAGEVQFNLHYSGFDEILNNAFDDFPGDFRAATTRTLLQHGVFESVAPESGHRLDVVISEVLAPRAGFSMTVGISTLWQLTRSGESQPYFTESIFGEHTEPFGSHFVGAIRMQRAVVGAARETIRQGVEAVARAAADK